MITQTIQYTSPNRYFGGFLQYIIDQSEIQANVSQNNNKITLQLDTSDQQKTALFNELVAKYLPHSIFLGEVTSTESTQEIQSEKFESDDYNIAPCSKCLELLTDPSSQYYLDESLECTHYSNKGIEKYEDYTIFSPHYSENSAVLITDPSKINELFIITDDELKTLFSIEKPTIKATIKDETIKELTKKNYIYIKLPYNNRSALAALNAKESGVEYLFFENSDDLTMVVVQKNHTIIKASRVATKLEELNTDKQINRFLNIANEASFTKGAIGANLSTHGINFLVSNELGVKKVIQFNDFDYTQLLHSFQHSEKRMKLYKNFQEKYPAIIEVLDKEQNPNLWFVIGSILELENKDFQAVSDKSYEFRGNGGLKIDMNFSENGFCYDDFIGSLISFKLAGVETHYLTYSIFEAFGDMAINTLNQLKEKFKLDNIIMMGDMFGNNVLYSRILSKYQLANPYFAKAIALDD